MKRHSFNLAVEQISQVPRAVLANGLAERFVGKDGVEVAIKHSAKILDGPVFGGCLIEKVRKRDCERLQKCQ